MTIPAPDLFRPFNPLAAIPSPEPVSNYAHGTDLGDSFPDLCERCGGSGIWLNRWEIPKGGGPATLGIGSPPDGKECWCPCSRGAEAREHVRRCRAGNTGVKEHAAKAMTFETFQGEAGPLRIAKAGLQRWAQEYRPGNLGFLLQGPSGTGKTHLLMACAGTIMAAGTGSLYRITGTDLSSRYRATWGGTGEETERGLAQVLTSCDVLFIDDLGAERPIEGVVEFTNGVVDTRIESGRTTCFATNLIKEKFINQLGERLYDRVRRSISPATTYKLQERFRPNQTDRTGHQDDERGGRE